MAKKKITKARNKAKTRARNKNPGNKNPKTKKYQHLQHLEIQHQQPKKVNESSNHNESKAKGKKPSMCAPFINPTDLSSDSKLSTANMNIIKSATDESCFSIEALRKIADKWNETHPNMRIDYTLETTGKSLWNSINNVMSSTCNNEVCWVKQPFIKETPLHRELLKSFKPMMPKSWEAKPTEWLNTIDIRDVMNQYEIKYPDFEFIGPVPMDFDSKMGFGQCVANELCQIDLKKLIEKGKRRIGVVFNLDKHNQPGSHWVAMFMCWDTKQCCYWDSYGMKPNPEVVNLMNRLKSQAGEMGHPLDIKINHVRHQYKNSECGVYCIYFLTSLLEGRTFEDIINNIISDDNMNSRRKDFFIKSE